MGDANEPSKATASCSIFKAPDGKVNGSEFEILGPEYYEARLSKTAKARKPSPVWDLFPVETQPGMLSMLAGKPNPMTFPFKAITLTVRGQNDEAPVDLVIQGDELVTGLQYSLTSGIPALRIWLTELMKKVHSRTGAEGWRVSIGSGSQDLLYKAFAAFLNPGDTILIESPTYPGILIILEALDCHVVQVMSDSEGLSPTVLEDVLSKWDSNQPFPKVLYTVPFGSNPTGATTNEARRIEILNLARKYDFVIFEDDPYGFLYYGPSPKPGSYFELEKRIRGTVGHVLRFDSFSKLISAGIRIGWITGPTRVVQAIELHSVSSTVQPASTGQAMLLKLVHHWGIQGFLDHTIQVAEFYRRKRDYFDACLHHYLSSVAEWSRPEASMFFWLKLNLPPITSSIDQDDEDSSVDSESFIRRIAIDRGILFLPGNTAYIDGRRTACVRASFSCLSEEEMEEAVKRLGDALREQWDIYYLQKSNSNMVSDVGINGSRS
ncbi:hypothetical protein M422DRAFT_209609 [Sphaerobolus stellatus SS14]|uniref:Aminotransferase class I/classII large domain-containing protein n=1 Tax=Sphaerobolus stellatus (strain SS14) TaxID=990650 RepID=A0A0C9V1G6_SPHS4|nr:hypothetical protein M422DRAFT_209609 [Sphaerobolus stellatus SS14]